MALNPVERKEFILACIPHIANGVLSNQELLESLDYSHAYEEKPTRKVQVTNFVYQVAVLLAVKYDAENP